MSNRIVVCLKWVIQAGEPDDARFAGVSHADHAALELALQWAERTGGQLTAITVGPPQAETVLRDAIACGASNGVRIDAPPTTNSADVAAAIASTAHDAKWVWCGDYSIDNGSGSVPAFIAGALGARQALGVVAVSFDDNGIAATRRIDGGRREVLAVSAPAVISVEGATTRLRRAGLTALHASATAPIDVVVPTIPMQTSQHTVQPYRPRTRALAMPSGTNVLERVRSLTATGTAVATHHEVETLAPTAAAARIVDALHNWGYL